MMYDKYDADEIIETLTNMVNSIVKIKKVLTEYEIKYNLSYDSYIKFDVFDRLRLLIEYLDKNMGEK